MAKTLRLTERWFRRGLWLVAVVFAGFLVGLGGAVVRDLPKVERPLQRDDFLDAERAQRLRTEAREAQREQENARMDLQQAQLKRQVAHANSTSARDTFGPWLATRRATQLPEQDAELLARTRTLEGLLQAEREALAAVERQQQRLLDAQQRERRARRELQAMEEQADERLAAERRRVELRVFGYRLSLTLPLLVLAAWLLRRHRHGRWWPFVWGFALFAGFTFFVELVPYLPSYGGYVRHGVGVLLTLVLGRQAIAAAQRYFEQQRRAEQLPAAERRQALPYETVLARLAKEACPGCERPVPLKDPTCDWCPHCGLGLFDRCPACRTRKSAFAHYCRACGTAAATPA